MFVFKTNKFFLRIGAFSKVAPIDLDKQATPETRFLTAKVNQLIAYVNCEKNANIYNSMSVPSPQEKNINAEPT